MLETGSSSVANAAGSGFRASVSVVSKSAADSGAARVAGWLGIPSRQGHGLAGDEGEGDLSLDCGGTLWEQQVRTGRSAVVVAGARLDTIAAKRAATQQQQLGPKRACTPSTSASIAFPMSPLSVVLLFGSMRDEK